MANNTVSTFESLSKHVATYFTTSDMTIAGRARFEILELLQKLELVEKCPNPKCRKLRAIDDIHDERCPVCGTWWDPKSPNKDRL